MGEGGAGSGWCKHCKIVLDEEKSFCANDFKINLANLNQCDFSCSNQDFENCACYCECFLAEKNLLVTPIQMKVVRLQMVSVNEEDEELRGG